METPTPGGGSAGGDGGSAGGDGGSNGGDGGSTGGGTVPPPPPPPPPPVGPTSPNYAANGFVGTDDTAFVTVAVLEMDADGFTESYRSGTPVEFEIRYLPGSGVSVYSEGTSFDGTVDAEGQTFTGNGTNFGFGSPNFVRVQSGVWSYATDGAIDQNDGQYRHVFALADGMTFPAPTFGFGLYDTTLGGTLEVFEQDSFSSTPLIAEGMVTILFDTNEVSALLTVDPSRSNGLTGAIASGSGPLTADGGFSQYGNSGITLDGDYIYTEGTIAGAIAGPNAQEVYGVVNFGGIDGNDYSAILTGSFLGTAPRTDFVD